MLVLVHAICYDRTQLNAQTQHAYNVVTGSRSHPGVVYSVFSRGLPPPHPNQLDLFSNPGRGLVLDKGASFASSRLICTYPDSADFAVDGTDSLELCCDANDGGRGSAADDTHAVGELAPWLGSEACTYVRERRDESDGCERGEGTGIAGGGGRSTCPGWPDRVMPAPPGPGRAVADAAAAERVEMASGT